MNIKDCFNLGNISKLHGFKGEVSLFLDVTNPEDYRKLDFIFIDINGQLIPFKIISLRLVRRCYAIVRLEGVDCEKDAKELLKKKTYLPLTFLPPLDNQSFYDHEVIGYKVEDSVEGNIGLVEDVIDLSNNPLLKINNKGKEILIPIMNDLVQKVDRENKILFISCPDGLLSLYI